MGLELYYGAFLDLTTCRSVGFGAGPIPWSAINDYAITFDIVGEMRDDLFCYVRELDSAYLEYQSKKDKAKK
jgi:hypothetical protein